MVNEDIPMGMRRSLYEVSRGSDFGTVELINVNRDDLSPQPPIPFV